MSKYFRYFEYAYLIIAVVFIYETFAVWSTQRPRAYLFLFMAALAIFMYFFKRRFRKKIEQRKSGK
ncbi:hypothetical protein [Zunongwangia sp.]|uniref:hypothetical protein n=1 Tax=Zunongwangia sp. TaxID=1965325 RepID=UPI003AA87441